MAVLNLVFDILILFMFDSMINSLKIDIKRKCSLIGIFWMASM